VQRLSSVYWSTRPSLVAINSFLQCKQCALHSGVAAASVTITPYSAPQSQTNCSMPPSCSRHREFPTGSQHRSLALLEPGAAGHRPRADPFGFSQIRSSYSANVADYRKSSQALRPIA
jgi:hypothetical protein